MTSGETLRDRFLYGSKQDRAVLASEFIDLLLLPKI